MQQLFERANFGFEFVLPMVFAKMHFPKQSSIVVWKQIPLVA